MASVLSLLQLWAFLSFYAVDLALCDLSNQNETSVHEIKHTFPKEKCESLLTNCSCYDYRDVVGIVCNEVNDFSNFSHFLATGAIFEVNTTYEITFTKISYLPPRVLEGLIVYRLFLDDPDLSNIDEHALDGVMCLRRFHVRRSKMKVAPDFGIIRNSIRTINIDQSNLRSIEGKSFQDLPLVEELFFVNNSIAHIDPDAFKGTEGVVVFDVSYNQLTYLPPNLIDPWINLTKFVVSHNSLLHLDQLFAKTHPKFIYLEFNNLTDVNSILHHNMKKVETLILAGNPIGKIETFFNERTPFVRFLYLDHCHLKEFDVKYFRGLDNLTTLDLSYNFIETVPKQSIQFGKSLELNLIGNRINKFEAEITFIVKRFYLSKNKLRNLGSFLQHTQIVEVSVSENQIQYLTEDDFRWVHATANLELQGNEIRRIDRMTFGYIKNDLNYLDLSSNFIPSLNGSIKYLSQLKLLNLTNNLLQTFESGEFTGLNELSELYLQNNRITALNGQLSQLPELQFLVLIQNKIETLSQIQIPNKSRYVYLADNPFKCDCRLLPFLLWLNNSDSPKTDIDLCLATDEENARNRPKVMNCPENCSCPCTQDGDLYFLSVDCSSKNLSDVPPFLIDKNAEEKNLSSITLDLQRSLVFVQNVYPSFHIEDQVLGIDLENNSLETLDSARFPPDLVNLYLADNRLRRMSEPMLYTLQNLKKVTLSENPWDCDCNALGFKKWLLSKTDVVQDINETYCGKGQNGDSPFEGRAVWTLTDFDVCPAEIGLYVSIAFTVLIFLLMCLAARIMYTKYELNIKVFLYSHGITWVKERDLDYDKKFEAFVSFSHKDESFVVREIISGIESKNPNIRLCIHVRDFKAGEFIQNNIIYAVQNSKRTILILSRNFLESEWCLMEFRTAHVQALEDKVHRIIVIKCGDLPKEIDPALQVYLDSTTYLTWGDKYFWDSLMYVLPTSSNERNPIPVSNSENKEKGSGGLNFSSRHLKV